MGDSPRSRSITIVNDDPSRLILVTESVVKRLKGACTTKPKEVEAPLHSVSTGPDIASKKTGSMTAHEEELVEMEKYWMDRLQNMDETHTRINHMAERDLERSLWEYERKFGSPVLSHPKCHLNIKEIIDCYKENPNQTLKCNKEINEFSKCLDSLYVSDCR